MSEENIFDISKYFTGRIDFSKVDPDFIAVKENIAALALEVQKKGNEAFITLYKERTNQGKVLEAIKETNINITKTGEDVKNTLIADNDKTRQSLGELIIETGGNTVKTVEETGSAIAAGIGAVGNSILSNLDSNFPAMSELIKNSTGEIKSELRWEGRETRYTVVKEGLGNADEIMKGQLKLEHNILGEITESTQGIIKTVEGEGRETRYNGYRNALKIEDLIRKTQQNLSGSIKNILEKQEDAGYMIAKAKVALEWKIESSAKKIRDELAEHDDRIQTSTDPVYRAMKKTGFKRDDVASFLAEIKEKGVNYKIRHVGEDVDFEFYAKLFVEGQKRAFSLREITEYALDEITANKTLKEAANRMSDYIYEKSNA